MISRFQIKDFVEKSKEEIYTCVAVKLLAIVDDLGGLAVLQSSQSITFIDIGKISSFHIIDICAYHCCNLFVKIVITAHKSRTKVNG